MLLIVNGNEVKPYKIPQGKLDALKKYFVKGVLPLKYHQKLISSVGSHLKGRKGRAMPRLFPLQLEAQDVPVKDANGETYLATVRYCKNYQNQSAGGKTFLQFFPNRYNVVPGHSLRLDEIELLYFLIHFSKEFALSENEMKTNKMKSNASILFQDYELEAKVENEKEAVDLEIRNYINGRKLKLEYKVLLGIAKQMLVPNSEDMTEAILRQFMLTYVNTSDKKKLFLELAEEKKAPDAIVDLVMDMVKHKTVDFKKKSSSNVIAAHHVRPDGIFNQETLICVVNSQATQTQDLINFLTNNKDMQTICKSFLEEKMKPA